MSINMMFLMCAPTLILFSFDLSTEQCVIEMSQTSNLENAKCLRASHIGMIDFDYCGLVPCCTNMSMNSTRHSLFPMSMFHLLIRMLDTVICGNSFVSCTSKLNRYRSELFHNSYTSENQHCRYDWLYQAQSLLSYLKSPFRLDSILLHISNHVMVHHVPFARCQS